VLAPPTALPFLGGVVGNCAYKDSIGILACVIVEYGSAIRTNQQENVYIHVGICDEELAIIGAMCHSCRFMFELVTM
jgi:hypothetical protein